MFFLKEFSKNKEIIQSEKGKFLVPIKGKLNWVIYHYKTNTIKTIYESPKNYSYLTRDKILNFKRKVRIQFELLKTFQLKILIKTIKYKFIINSTQFSVEGKSLREFSEYIDYNQSVSPLFIKYLSYLKQNNHPELQYNLDKWESMSFEKKKESTIILNIINKTNTVPELSSLYPF